MKTIALISLMFMGFLLPAFGQLNIVHNHFRSGDVLVKQQVEFIDPGSAGVNQVWDFSKVKTINNQYTLTFSLPPLLNDSLYIMGYNQFLKDNTQENELVTGTEHNTMYYYRLTGDSLLQLGHENPTVKLEYTTPMVLMKFPLNYGQTVFSEYKSKGVYSSTIEIQSEGTMVTTADAYGKMILPSGDTLSPVLRIKTIQTIHTIPGKYSIDKDGAISHLETCKWYTKGYRYPIFETIKSINAKNQTPLFSTAFFFPPQDHLYLDTDPDNLALLDELWKETETPKDDPTTQIMTLSDIMICKIYPNPVTSILNLEYELKESAKVSFELYSLNGLPVKKTVSQDQQAGVYFQSIDCSGLQPRNYILKITANGLVLNGLIIKE